LSDLFRTWEDDVYPGAFSYYTYWGSLTSPPCEEYTQWFIVKDHIEFGFSGLEMMKKVLIHTPPAIQVGECDDAPPEPVMTKPKNARVT